MKMLKLLSLVGAVVTLGALTTSPAAAGTDDFFQCPEETRLAQPTRFLEGRFVWYESCWSRQRNKWVFRGNIFLPENGDELRMAYYPYNAEHPRWVAHSYRSAPRDLDKTNPETMPTEWFLADNWADLQACLTIYTPYYETVCTWPE